MFEVHQESSNITFTVQNIPQVLPRNCFIICKMIIPLANIHYKTQ